MSNETEMQLTLLHGDPDHSFLADDLLDPNRELGDCPKCKMEAKEVDTTPATFTSLPSQ